MAARNNLSKLTLPMGAKGCDQIPSVGFGCWKVPRDVCASVVFNVIKVGYRALDCAADYGNEKEVGEGVRQAIEAGIVKREDLFITSKLWNTFHRPEHVELACKKTLSDLGLEYVDLYLIHFPIALKFVPFEKRYPPEWFHDPSAPQPKMELDEVPVQDTWQAMEKLHEGGLVKNIGVANFNCHGLRDLFSYAKIKPAVLQVELHPLLQQQLLVRYAQSKGMHVTAFSPLGHGLSYFNESVSALKEPTVQEIAKEAGKTPAQVILRWNLQRGVSVIPKTEKEERMKENIDLFDFQLSDQDMEKIKSVEKNFRFNDPGVFCEAAFNTFCPIYE